MTQDTPAAPAAPQAEPSDYNTLKLYNDLQDLLAEASAVDTVIGRPEVLRNKIAKMRDTVGGMSQAWLPQAATSAAGGATGDLPEAAWPAGTRGMLGENAYDADQMRQHFNAGREFEAGRLAALAAQSPDSGAGPAYWVDLLRAAQAITSRQDAGGYNVYHAHLVSLDIATRAVERALAQQGAQNGR